jgi:hypothetical protein
MSFKVLVKERIGSFVIHINKDIYKLYFKKNNYRGSSTSNKQATDSNAKSGITTIDNTLSITTDFHIIRPLATAKKVILPFTHTLFSKS